MPSFLENSSIKKTLHFFQQPTVIVIVSCVISILISIQLLVATKVDPKPGWPTRYNNYEIFSNSFWHLLENKDLYTTFPEEHYDYYKYSPSFPVFMLPFAMLPDWLGLNLWNLLNVLVLIFAILKIPYFTPPIRAAICYLILPEVIISVQNSQCNALLAGLSIWTFILLEKNRLIAASILVVLSAYIKIFGVLLFIIFLFYKNYLKSFSAALIATISIGILPLFFIDIPQIIFLYKSWFHLLSWDFNDSIGLSVQGWLQTWFHFTPASIFILLVGIISLLLPIFQFNKWSNISFKINYLATILIWLVIFNHKAESPTFVIAFTGVLLWYYNSQKRNWETILFISAFILVSLSPTDLFPQYLREHLVKPYVLKAFPCIAIYAVLIFELLRKNRTTLQVN